MSVLEKEREVELVVTWVCNWDCEYCCVDTHNRGKLMMEEVKDKIKKIDYGCNVTISGGEPGALKRKDIDYILGELDKKNCTPSINTNGTFLRKYPDLINKFDDILYHCSENIDINDELIEGDFNYLLIVTDNNIQNLDAFLEKHKLKKFNLVAATNPEGIDKCVLSTKNKYNMLKKHHKQMTEESIKRIFNEKDFDAITYI